MIFFSGLLLERIATSAETVFPDECCGLLVGHSLEGGGLTVSHVEASPNRTQGARHDSFEVDPKLRFDLMRELADGAERIVGHYHSHPGGLAEPSGRDLVMAWEPELVWIITSVVDGLAISTRAWRLNKVGDGFSELVITVPTADKQA